MAKVIIIYYSRTGNTKQMAGFIAEGIQKEGVGVDVKDVSSVRIDDLLAYEGIVIGSPTYYGTMSAEIKKLIDDSVKFHGKLDGKVGAAFSSSYNTAGGNETTVMDIVSAMLVHGMIVQGDHQGDHYGPVAIKEPDARAKKECLRRGQRVAQLVKKIFGG